MTVDPIVDATILLARALRVSARAAGASLAITAIDDRFWASGTFAGTRHRIDLLIDRGAAADAWLAMLPDAELPMRGHLLADLAYRRSGETVTLQALTIATE